MASHSLAGPAVGLLRADVFSLVIGAVEPVSSSVLDSCFSALVIGAEERLVATATTATTVSRRRFVSKRATRVQIVDHIPALTEPARRGKKGGE